MCVKCEATKLILFSRRTYNYLLTCYNVSFVFKVIQTVVTVPASIPLLVPGVRLIHMVVEAAVLLEVLLLELDILPTATLLRPTVQGGQVIWDHRLRTAPLSQPPDRVEVALRTCTIGDGTSTVPGQDIPLRHRQRPRAAVAAAGLRHRHTREPLTGIIRNSIRWVDSFVVNTQGRL